jgi:protein-S-isoprenylcysteine O-methyltransferase Ste14
VTGGNEMSPAPLEPYERTKLYDFLTALPLVLWYVERLWERWPNFRDVAGKAFGGEGDSLTILRLLAEIGTFGFVLTAILFLLIRTPPKAKAPGALPRIVAFIGTFAPLAFIAFTPAVIGLPAQAIAAVSIVCGWFYGIYALIFLGRAFSIMAEARALRTTGPYAFVRHPLYLAEELIVLGAMIQYPQPWAVMIGIGQFAFQLIRMRNEERVLAAAFPEYTAYAARTARLIPGVW